MTKSVLLLFSALVFLAFSCTQKQESTQQETQKQETKAEEIIGKPTQNFTSDVLTPEILWSLGRVSGGKVSPDGKTVLYGITYYDIKKNKGNRELYLIDVDGKNKTRLTNTNNGEFEEKWRPDGKKIGFLSTESGSVQLWEMRADGTNKKQITDIEGGINNFAYSPKGDKIVYTADVQITNVEGKDIYADLPKANAKIYDKLMYRHWDHWEDGKYSHIFIADYAHGKVSNAKDIMKGEEWDAPTQPWGGIEEVVWKPDGSEIAYVCKKKTGKDYAVSTNSDIFIYNLASGETKNLTEGMMGYDKEPVYSPDGTKLAWWSMERDGFEADHHRIFIYDFAAKTKKNYSEKFDQNAANLNWAPDGKNLYFISGIHATYQLYSLNVENNEFKQITKGDHNYVSLSLAGDKIIAGKQNMLHPTELYSVNITDGKATEISYENKDVLGKLKPAKITKRWIKTTNNKDMLTWVVLPPGFDSTKTYPALLYCQGGPQSAISQFYSIRWNFSIMAANGYIVVAPNRHGLPTFGQEWTDQISKDYGGQNMKDVLKAIDVVKKEPYVDENRLGSIGASYGGYSVYWLAGNHEKRFKAFISHCGIFNFDAMYTSTEEVFFTDWDMGGSPWNKQAKNSYGASPHLFAKNWDTPILVIHGEKDFRIPYTQGMMAFNTARLQGIPARYLHFPTENHWVLSCQNGILWQREFKAWLDKYLK